MRENYAARIYDFGKLDQRLEDVWGDEPAVVALMRLVDSGEWWAMFFSLSGAQTTAQHSIMHDKFVCHCGIIISAGTT